jgi:hypothetical protein
MFLVFFILSFGHALGEHNFSFSFESNISEYNPWIVRDFTVRFNAYTGSPEEQLWRSVLVPGFGD